MNGDIEPDADQATFNLFDEVEQLGSGLLDRFVHHMVRRVSNEDLHHPLGRGDGRTIRAGGEVGVGQDVRGRRHLRSELVHQGVKEAAPGSLDP